MAIVARQEHRDRPDIGLRIADIAHGDHRALRRLGAGRPCVLIAIHSFTPVFKDVARPWHVGVLYNRDARLARPLLDLLRQEGDLVVGDNQPYAISDDSDYGIPVHGEQRGIPHVELEIRQDLIADPAGERAWAARLARLLPAALERLAG